MIEIVPEYTDIQKTSLDETGWTGFNTPHSSNVGQTYGPAGMGIGAYMDRPESQPGFTPFMSPSNFRKQVAYGIPATNQGYKVWNASDPTGNYGWLDRLRRWLFNDPYDKESDESLYQDMMPPEEDEALGIDSERSSREFNKFQEKFEPAIQRQSQIDYQELIDRGVDPMEGIFMDYMPYFLFF